jgi:hypothetical protein
MMTTLPPFRTGDLVNSGRCKSCGATQLTIGDRPSDQRPVCGRCVAREMIRCPRYVPVRNRRAAVAKFLAINTLPDLCRVLQTDPVGIAALRQRLVHMPRGRGGPPLAKPKYKTTAKREIRRRQTTGERYVATVETSIIAAREPGVAPVLPESGGCAWPIGEPGTRAFHFCNAPPYSGLDLRHRLKKFDYCRTHVDIAFTRETRPP